MFHYASGLRLTSIDLAVDVRTRQMRGFISHAHMDHMAPHELIFCTPATARLVQHRLGQRLIHELPFGEPLDWDGVRLTTFPAGHILGSAMLLADEGGTSLLYTGDFKLGASATAEPAEPPRGRQTWNRSHETHPRCFARDRHYRNRRCDQNNRSGFVEASGCALCPRSRNRSTNSTGPCVQ